jgi:hypothetical protein
MKLPCCLCPFHLIDFVFRPVTNISEDGRRLVLHWTSCYLCKIWGFDSFDYEEWCLLGYKNPVRTSQKTHYVFATESSQLMLCKIWSFHGGYYEEYRLLGCYAVWLLKEPMFQRNISPPSSGLVWPWWKRHIPPNHRYIHEPHSVISQKTTFFKAIALRTWNCTRLIFTFLIVHLIRLHSRPLAVIARDAGGNPQSSKRLSALWPLSMLAVT